MSSSPELSGLPRLDLEQPSDAELQVVLADAVRQYAGRLEQTNFLPAFPGNADITATEVMLVSPVLLHSVNL